MGGGVACPWWFRTLPKASESHLGRERISCRASWSRSGEEREDLGSRTPDFRRTKRARLPASPN